MQFSTTDTFFLGVVVTLVGWLIVHQLSTARDCENRKHAAESSRKERKRSFLAFMDQWRSEVERCKPVELVSHYAAKVHLFREAAARVRDDMPDRNQFAALVQSLSSITATQISDHPYPAGRDVILSRLDALVNFTDDA